VVGWNSTSTEPMAVLSMVSASDDTLFPKGRLVSNHKLLYLDRLFASTISKVSVKDYGLNHSKVATLIWTTQLALVVLVFYWTADSDPHLYITSNLLICQEDLQQIFYFIPAVFYKTIVDRPFIIKI
jgi:hypothetical protein